MRDGPERRHPRRWVIAFCAAVVLAWRYLGKGHQSSSASSHEQNSVIGSENQQSSPAARVGFLAVVVALVGLAVGFGVAGYTYRPADSGPPPKPSGALQLVDLVVNQSDTDAAIRLSLDSSHEFSSYIQIGLGIDTGPTPVKWAVVLCFDGPVTLKETSTEPAPIAVQAVLPQLQPDLSTYLIGGTVARFSHGYSGLRSQLTTQSDGTDVYPIQLLANGLRAARYETPYLTIPVAVGLSDSLRENGLSALAPDPQRLLRALDADALGWNPVAAHSAVEYQSNLVPHTYTPDGVLSPQSSASSWYWDLNVVPRSSENYATARSPSALAREQRHVFWSGVYLALAGSALLAVFPLGLAWPRKARP
jgi:hypothetical protein